jgi:hypothetical protein
MIEAISCSETSATFDQTTKCHIPGDSTVLSRRCESLKSKITDAFLQLFFSKEPKILSCVGVRDYYMGFELDLLITYTQNS